MTGCRYTLPNTDKPCHLSPQDTDNILAYAWELKKLGRTEATNETVSRRLRQLQKNCKLNNPEEVKAYIAYAELANSTKTNFVQIYTGYAKHLNARAVLVQERRMNKT